VQTLDFVEHHRPALEREEVRHNVILANLGRLALAGGAEMIKRLVPVLALISTPALALDPAYIGVWAPEPLKVQGR
jgi:hypothetical protein